MPSYALDASAVAVMLYRECQLDRVFNDCQGIDGP